MFNLNITMKIIENDHNYSYYQLITFHPVDLILPSGATWTTQTASSLRVLHTLTVTHATPWEIFSPCFPTALM